MGTYRKKPPSSTPAPLRKPRGLLTGAVNGVYQQRVCELELEITRLREQLNQSEHRAYLAEHYQKMFEHGPVPSVVVDEIGMIHDTNLEFRRLVHARNNRPVEGPFLQFVTRDKVSLFLSHLHEAKDHPSPVSVDLSLRSFGAQIVPVELISLPIDTYHGFKRIRSVVIDTSHRRTVTEALATTKFSLRAVIDAVQCIFWEANASTLDVTFMSASARQILGYPSEAWTRPGFFLNHIHVEDREAVATMLARLAHPSRGKPQRKRVGQRDTDEENTVEENVSEENREEENTQEELKALLEQPRSQPRTVHLEFRMITAGRRIVWLHSTVSLRESAGKRRLVGVGLDITGRKLAEQDLQRAHQQLEQRIADRTAQLQETLSQLETFSYSLSHDMRAPLRSIHGFCEMLRERLADKLGPFEHDLFRRVTTSATRLDRLIQDVLHYSKVTRTAVELKPVRLDRLMESTLKDYPSLEATGAEIQIEQPLLPVLGHEAFLTQCFSNLLSNAVKFVRPGDTAHVRIRTEPMNSLVRVWVEDNGIGIEPDDQKKVFSIFQRFHHAPNLYEGTGLGLAIVQKAVERMGGRVGVESVPGEGSRFWFELRAASEFVNPAR